MRWWKGTPRNERILIIIGAGVWTWVGISVINLLN